MKAVHFAVIASLTAALFGPGEIDENSATWIASSPRSQTDTVPKKNVYRDLSTGETIDIWYDRVGKRTLNKRTGAPVDFYVNTTTNDTVFGRGRFIVNDYILKGADGKWQLNDGKVKMDGDELKVTSGDKQFKIDGDDTKSKSKEIKAKPEMKTSDR